MDEVFDNMGGGRNSRGGTMSRGSGIIKSNLLGLNYSDQLFKNLQTNASYNYSDTNTENKNHSFSTNFVPDQPDADFTKESNSKSRYGNNSNKANVELEYKVGSDIRIFVAPKFNNTKSDSYSKSDSRSDALDGTKINDFDSETTNRNENNNFSNSINFNKSFEKKVRNLSIVLNNNNSNSNSNGITESTTNTYKTSTQEIRHQNNLSENINDSYSAEIEYTEPVTDSLRFRIGIEYNYKNSINDAKTYNFNDIDQSYSDFNVLQSNYTTSKQNSIAPKAGFRFEKNKFTFDIHSTTSIVQYDNFSFYNEESTNLNKNYILPNINGQIRYRMERSKFASIRYNYDVSLPSSNQILPVENLSNPLNTVVGNPDLNPNKRHNANLFYRNFDFNTRSGYSVYFNGNYNSSAILSTTEYDENRKGTTSYQNISGTYAISGGGNWNKSIKQEDNLLRFGISFNANYSFNKGYNNVLYGAKSTGVSPRIYLNYDYGEFFTIAPSYNFSYNETKYDISTIRSRSNVVHSLNLQTNSYWPKNWIWGNDFGYTYNSNLSSGLRKDFYLWNTSLSYTFYEDKFTAKIKVYDVLNQNQSISRNISTDAVTDSENTILKRYAMFSLTYKIKDFSGMKNPPERRNFRGGRYGRGPQGPSMED